MQLCLSGPTEIPAKIKDIEPLKTFQGYQGSIPDTTVTWDGNKIQLILLFFLSQPQS